jgi:uncharacterized protein YbjT (DUF2867 family)
MKILLLGASGRSGRAVIDEATARGHAVTAFGRTPIKPANPTVANRSGDPRRVDDVAGALPGHDAVISCLGQRSSADSTLLADSARAVVAALSRTPGKPPRFIVVSQGLLSPSASPLVGLLRWILARQTADSRAMEAVVRKAPCAWTIVRPPRLTSGPSASYVTAISEQPSGPASMSRAALACALVDFALSDECAGKIVGVTRCRAG